MTAHLTATMRPSASRHTLPPPGFAIRLRPDVARYSTVTPGERVLVGGSPTRSLRLSPAAVSMFDGEEALAVTTPMSAAVARRLLDANVADPILGDPADAADLTVVVPVRDRVAQLDRCLTALEGLEVIVVDDASHDPAAVEEVVRRHGASLVVLQTNAGPAAARNAGLGKVQTSLVAFVDSDVTAPAQTLLALADHFRDPAVGVVGPLVRGIVRSQHPRWFERYDAAASSLALGHRACSVEVGAAVGWLPSACIVARTNALRDLGGCPGFDPMMRVGEDVDLIWRLLGSGWRVRYDPAFEVGHDVRGELAALLGRKLTYGTGSAPLAERHGGAVAVARLTPLMAAAGAGVLLRRPWSIGLSIAATWWARGRVLDALPAFEQQPRAATALALRGLGWSVRQESSLLLRHWWPAAAVAGAISPSVRRMLISAWLVDTAVVATLERPLRRPDLPPTGVLGTVIGRRLDDLSYGLGVWLGAIRSRSLQPLRVSLVRRFPSTTHNT